MNDKVKMGAVALVILLAMAGFTLIQKECKGKENAKSVDYEESAKV